VSKDIGLAHDHLLGLREKEGGDAFEIGGEELRGRGENVYEAEERSLVEGLDRPYYLLTVWTLVAVKEDGNVGVCGH